MYGSGILRHGPSGFRVMSCMILAFASMFSSFTWQSHSCSIIYFITRDFPCLLCVCCFAYDPREGAEQCISASGKKIAYGLFNRCDILATDQMKSGLRKQYLGGWGGNYKAFFFFACVSHYNVSINLGTLSIMRWRRQIKLQWIHPWLHRIMCATVVEVAAHETFGTGP